MSQAQFSDQLRQSHNQHFRKFLQAVEREKFGRPLTHADYIRDARVTTESCEHRLWPADVLYAIGDGWRKPWIPFLPERRLPWLRRLLRRLRGIQA